METEPRIAVLLPCYNEAQTVGKVVDDFRKYLPQAVIYVFDNRSTDDTARIAAEHGATVIYEPRQGKGYVIESMLNRVDADFYVMADGDDTYPAEVVDKVLAPVLAGRADMVVGARLEKHEEAAFRPLHTAGNRLVRWLINRIFGAKLTDILSGYRAFNRRLAETIPVVSSGFEVETEMTVQVLYNRLAIVEVPVDYRARPEGSSSKLRTFRDGARVLWKVFSLMRAFKPLTVFGGCGIVLFALGVAVGLGPVRQYAATGGVTQYGRAILATGLVTLSALSVLLGLMLHAVNWRFKELHNVMTRRPR